MASRREGEGDYRTPSAGTERGSASISRSRVVSWICSWRSTCRWSVVTAGSPYYNPHIQRPALFPPSDGYLPPEDPLVGVARRSTATAALKRHRPELTGRGVRVLVSPGMAPERGPGGGETGGPTRSASDGPCSVVSTTSPRTCSRGVLFDRKRLCRTFSDCTTAPRQGMVSGCYPLDSYYRGRPEAARLTGRKRVAL